MKRLTLLTLLFLSHSINALASDSMPLSFVIPSLLAYGPYKAYTYFVDKTESLPNLTLVESKENCLSHSLKACDATSVGVIELPPEDYWIANVDAERGRNRYYLHGIESKAFRNCSKVSTIIMPSTIKWISKDAFQGCSPDLKVIFYGDAPSFVGADCESLSTVTGYYLPNRKGWSSALPIQVKPLPIGGLYDFNESSKTATLIAYSQPTITSATISLPSTVGRNGIMYAIDAIASTAFTNCTPLHRVVLPTQLTAIPEYLFANQEQLKEVVCGEKLQTIASWAFNGCKRFTSLSFPNGSGLKTIRSDAFSGCLNYRQPYGSPILENVEARAFSAAGVTEPTDFKTIQEGAFFQSIGEHLIFDSVLESIEADAFGNSAMKSIDFSRARQLRTIQEGAFKSCSKIRHVTLPRHITQLGESEHPISSFQFWEDLDPSWWPEWCKVVFYSRKGYYEYQVFKNGVFQRCANLTHVDCGQAKNLKQLGCATFAGCSRLTYLTLPPQLEKISYAVFADCCNLDVILFPNTLKTIEANLYPKTKEYRMLSSVFEGCERLRYLIFTGKPPVYQENLPSSAPLAHGYCYPSQRQGQMLWGGRTLGTLQDLYYHANNGTDQHELSRLLTLGKPHSSQLKACPFTHGKKHFKGWSTTPTGPVVYPGQASLSSLSLTADQDALHLYALWE